MQECKLFLLHYHQNIGTIIHLYRRVFRNARTDRAYDLS